MIQPRHRPTSCINAQLKALITVDLALIEELIDCRLTE